MTHTDENASLPTEDQTNHAEGSTMTPKKSRSSFPIPKAHLIIALAILIIVSLLLLINRAVEQTPGLTSFANMSANYATTASASDNDDKSSTTADNTASLATTLADTSQNDASQALASQATDSAEPALNRADSQVLLNNTTANASAASTNNPSLASTATTSTASTAVSVPASAVPVVQPATDAVTTSVPSASSAATSEQPKPNVVAKPTTVQPTAKPISKPASKAVSAKANSANNSQLSYHKAPARYFTIQFMGSYQENNVRHFAQQHHLQGYLVYQTQHNGKPWFVLVNGIYPTLTAAKSALAQLPKSLQQEKPWPKTLKQVQQELKK